LEGYNPACLGWMDVVSSLIVNDKNNRNSCNPIVNKRKGFNLALLSLEKFIKIVPFIQIVVIYVRHM